MIDALTLKPEAFALDISDLSLKIIKLKKQKSSFSLSSFGETKIPQGVIRQGEIRKEDVLVKIIKEAIPKVKGEKIKTKYLVASLPEEKAYLEVIQMPKLAPEDLRAAVIYEAENYIPLPIEQVYLDSQIVQPVFNHLDHQDVLLAGLPQKIVDSYLACFKKAGLIPLVLEIESLAISRALIKDEISQEPLALIDFGATRTGFIIFSGSSLRFTSSIPVSSQKLTAAVANFLKIDLIKAEKLKIEYGLETRATKKGGEVFDALVPGLTDLVEQIKKHLDFYQTHVSHEHLPANGKTVKKVILCGGGSNLKGFREFLARELNLEVELANPWINILSDDKKEKLAIPLDKALSYTTALGLALREIE